MEHKCAHCAKKKERTQRPDKQTKQNRRTSARRKKHG